MNVNKKVEEMSLCYFNHNINHSLISIFRILSNEKIKENDTNIQNR